MSTTKSKSDRAQTEVRPLDKRLEEKKAEVTDAENPDRSDFSAQIQNAENDVRWRKPMLTIEENKVREAEAAHDPVVGLGCSSTEKSGFSSGSLVDADTK